MNNLMELLNYIQSISRDVLNINIEIKYKSIFAKWKQGNWDHPDQAIEKKEWMNIVSITLSEIINKNGTIFLPSITMDGSNIDEVAGHIVQVIRESVKIRPVTIKEDNEANPVDLIRYLSDKK